MIKALTYSFPNFEPVSCSISSSNCCFLTHIKVSQETAKVVWYFYLFKNFPQFVVIHTVKSFSGVSEAEVYVFLEFSCFLYDPMDVGKLISGSPISKNFPQFVVIHTVKGFSIVSEAEIYVFLEFSCFFYDPMDVGNLTSGLSAFFKSSLYI